jgi:protease I
VISLQAGEIKGWDKKDWGRPVKVDKVLDQVSAKDYDAVVLPGGQINPDLLRVEPKALQFIKDNSEAKKVVAAVCHAPWLLIETGIAKCRKMTSFKSINTDVMNAGSKWQDSEVVVDQGVITSRNPGDLKAFSAKIIEEIKEGAPHATSRLVTGRFAKRFLQRLAVLLPALFFSSGALIQLSALVVYQRHRFFMMPLCGVEPGLRLINHFLAPLASFGFCCGLFLALRFLPLVLLS